MLLIQFDVNVESFQEVGSEEVDFSIYQQHLQISFYSEKLAAMSEWINKFVLNLDQIEGLFLQMMF